MRNYSKYSPIPTEDLPAQFARKSQSWPPAIKKPSGSSAKGIFATARHSKGSGVETQTRPTMRAKGSSSIHGIP